MMVVPGEAWLKKRLRKIPMSVISFSETLFQITKLGYIMKKIIYFIFILADHDTAGKY